MMHCGSPPWCRSASSTARFSGGVSVPKEKGRGFASPSCTLHLVEVHRSGRLTRGGVPVLKRRRGRPRRQQALRQARSAACSPSGPEGSTQLPHDGAARQVGAGGQDARPSPGRPPRWRVTTAETCPSSSPDVHHLSPGGCGRFSCRSRVCFMYLLVAAGGPPGPAGTRRRGPCPGSAAGTGCRQASAARPISPPRASSSRTRWPLPVPPMAGLQGMLPTASRLMVKHRRLAAQPGRGQGRLDAGVARADDGHVVAAGVKLSHVALSFSSVMTATWGRLKSRRAQRGELPRPRETKTSAAGCPPSVQG